MRYLILILLISFASCKKCYQCTTTVYSFGNAAVKGQSSQGNHEFCGSKSQVKEIEAKGTTTNKAYTKQTQCH